MRTCEFCFRKMENNKGVRVVIDGKTAYRYDSIGCYLGDKSRIRSLKQVAKLRELKDPKREGKA